MTGCRFIHAADLHLDSPFRGMFEVNPETAAVLRDATFRVFDAIIDLCIRERVDALLVAGDIFDSADRSLRAQLAFERGLRRLDTNHIRCFICHGNHDPLNAWDAHITLPPSAHRFGQQIEAVSLRPDDPDSVVIYGISYPRRDVRDSLVPRFLESFQKGKLSIGLMHANVGNQAGHENYAACTFADLEAVGINYWALGHIHTRLVKPTATGVMAFPGNPQGRSVVEEGPKGVLLVTISDSGSIQYEFKAVDQVRWGQIQVDVAAASDRASLDYLIDQSVQKAREDADGRHLVYRLVLSGRSNMHTLLSSQAYREDQSQSLNSTTLTQLPFAYCERVESATRPAIDRASWAQTTGFVGDVIRTFDQLPNDPDGLEALCKQLRPLFERREVRQYLPGIMPTADAVRAMLADGEALCLDHLVSAEDE